MVARAAGQGFLTRHDIALMMKEMGYADVRNLGGFKDWVAAGGAVEQ